MNFEVFILEDAKEFLNSLDIKMKAKSFRTIELLQNFRPNLREPYSKALFGYGGLFELRVKLGNNILRFFYFHDKGKFYIITSGYTKKTNKTEKKEIEKAVRLMKLYKGDSL